MLTQLRQKQSDSSVRAYSTTIVELEEWKKVTQVETTIYSTELELDLAL